MTLGSTIVDGLTGAATGIVGGPIGMVVGLLGGIAPDLLGAFIPHLAGPQGAAVAQAVVATVSAVTGVDNPTAKSIATLSPDARADLQVKLMQIAMQAEAARLADAVSARQADLAQLQAGLGDAEAARNMTQGLAESHSALAYGAVVVSVVIVAAFGVATITVLNGSLNGNPYGLTLIGTLAAMATQVANYWLGSSSGSRSKDYALANSMPVVPAKR